LQQQEQSRIEPRDSEWLKRFSANKQTELGAFIFWMAENLFLYSGNGWKISVYAYLASYFQAWNS